MFPSLRQTEQPLMGSKAKIRSITVTYWSFNPCCSCCFQLCVKQFPRISIDESSSRLDVLALCLQCSAHRRFANLNIAFFGRFPWKPIRTKRVCQYSKEVRAHSRNVHARHHAGVAITIISCQYVCGLYVGTALYYGFERISPRLVLA